MSAVHLRQPAATRGPGTGATYAEDPPLEPRQRHLAFFLANVRAGGAVPMVHSFQTLHPLVESQRGDGREADGRQGRQPDRFPLMELVRRAYGPETAHWLTMCPYI